VGVDSDQFQREELKRDQFDLFQIEFSFAILLFLSIAVKDWAKPPSDHIDPYHGVYAGAFDWKTASPKNPKGLSSDQGRRPHYRSPPRAHGA
jgi:hypothetical protein